MTGPKAGVTVRSAGRSDLPQLVRLLAGGALVEGTEDPDDLDRYREALDEIMAAPGSDVLVAEDGGEVVGMCQLVTFRHLQRRGGRCGELESVHVRADRRSRGIGGALVEAAAARAAAAGCYRLQLTSNRVRADAHRFFERHGFVPSHVGYKRPLA